MLNFQKLSNRLAIPGFKTRIETFLTLLPGFVFVSLGISVFFAPSLVLLLIAGFFVSFGILVLSLGLKFLALKRKLSMFSSQIEARLIVDTGKMGGLQPIDSVESKKVVYH